MYIYTAVWLHLNIAFTKWPLKAQLRPSSRRPLSVRRPSRRRRPLSVCPSSVDSYTNLVAQSPRAPPCTSGPSQRADAKTIPNKQAGAERSEDLRQ